MKNSASKLSINKSVVSKFNGRKNSQMTISVSMTFNMTISASVTM